MANASVSCLTEIDDPLLLDASVIVNLNATGFADRILEAIPASVFVSEPVVRELNKGADLGHQDFSDLSELINSGLVKSIKVPKSALSDYIALASGATASSLGDGEAATIAIASSTGAWAAIDERKARRICANGYAQIKIASTVDLLAHPNVLSSMTDSEFSTALLAALEVANMQVHEQHMDWVISHIDPDRIHRCSSLPLTVRRRFGS